jgi:DNA polymerase-3 subunit gamma/tau
MEAFVVSARKYRPQEFDSVIGQQHITRTLLNAVDKNQLGQALLFTGPRGVGKTTCARILAKMINRTSIDDTTDYSLNIFELDAASNNSVEDIRNLVDQVRFAPQVGSYKIYIIDEVHMLSTSAFNAFLKTLEEPPKHAVFILATTEKHKILPTILSRCQIYDFRRINVSDIVINLKDIATKEGVNYEENALQLVAQKADGAMRDALSIFDRLVSFSEGNVTYKAAAELLSVLDYNYYFRITDALLAGQAVEVIETVHEILHKGFDLHLMINGLADHLRNLWMCKDSRTVNLLPITDDLKSKYLEQSQQATGKWLVFALRRLMEVDLQYKVSQQQQLLVEVCLLRLAAPDDEEKKNDTPPVKTTSGFSPKIAQSAPSISLESSEKPATSAAEPKIDSIEKNKTQTESVKNVEFTPSGKTPVEAAQTVPTPRQVQNEPAKTAARRSGFSITASLNSINSEEVAENELATETIEKDADFSLSEEHLQQYYRLFVERTRERDQTLLASTLQSITPRKKDDYVIGISLHSETQKTLLGEVQTEIMAFLREKLGHAAIELDIEMLREEAENTVKTPKEKLDIILNEHPESQLLIDQLGLTLDY